MIASVFISLAVLAADVNGDQTINGSDLAVVMSQWGGAGSGDLNGDGVVNAGDISMVLGTWGRSVALAYTGDWALWTTRNGEWIASPLGDDLVRLRDRNTGQSIDQLASTIGMIEVAP